MHQDVKPENVLLVTNRNIAKLSDYGMAKRGTVVEKGKGFIVEAQFKGCTPKYRSPEVLLNYSENKLNPS